MPVRNQSVHYEISSKEAVLSFIEALNDNDFDGARSHIDDNMIFEGVMGSRHGGDEYMRDMRKMKFKYAIQKVFEDGDDVCVWYNINMGAKQIFSAGWYTVTDGKISSFKVIFDPGHCWMTQKNNQPGMN